MLRLTTLVAGLMLTASAFALSLSDLSQSDATGGLKDALTQGAQLAVAQLGRPGGFANNPEVRIELPGNLGKAARTMRRLGMGSQVDQLEASMNSAAEAAVPEAQALLIDAVKKMTVQDAKGILTGGEDAATQYLNRSSREQIRSRFLPIVKQANTFAGQAAAFGALDARNASIENYVTEKALDGLFEMIARQEANIRKDPASAATGLAKKVFGLL